MRILIVEDEAAIVRFLERGLAAHGHQLVSAQSGEDGVVLAADETIDFLLIDVSLPGIDGHEVLRRIRATRPDLPVLMLTARDDLQNKIRALDAGADDYLTKPFAFEELLARIRALTRRVDQPRSAQFALLEHFMRRPGQVLSREQILSAIWDYAFEPGSNIVDVYIRYLRRKIDHPGEPSLITTVRGAGYRFDPPTTASTPS
jgi:DNA-binding response OmpR family regulator